MDFCGEVYISCCDRDKAPILLEDTFTLISSGGETETGTSGWGWLSSRTFASGLEILFDEDNSIVS